MIVIITFTIKSFSTWTIDDGFRAYFTFVMPSFHTIWKYFFTNGAAFLPPMKFSHV